MASTTAETTAQLQCVQQGGPFKLVHVPTTQPGPNGVLIKQRIIAFNLIDVKQRDYGIMIPSWPFVLGSEGAGVVEAVGSSVTDLQPGDEVAAWENGPGCGGAFQERVEVPRTHVMKKPTNVTLEEAASMPTTFATAVCLVMNTLKIPLPFISGTSTEGKAPSSILVLGGSSAVGAAAIQLLRRAHPSLPILATSSAKHTARVKTLGASAVFDYKSGSLVSAVQKASPGGSGVDVILDCVGAGAAPSDTCDALDANGSKIYGAVITGMPIKVPQGVTLIEGGAASMFEMKGGMGLIPGLTALVEEGKFRPSLPVRVVGHGLEKVGDLLDEVKGASGEKIVMTV